MMLYFDKNNNLIEEGMNIKHKDGDIKTVHLRSGNYDKVDLFISINYLPNGYSLKYLNLQDWGIVDCTAWINKFDTFINSIYLLGFEKHRVTANRVIYNIEKPVVFMLYYKEGNRVEYVDEIVITNTDWCGIDFYYKGFNRDSIKLDKIIKIVRMVEVE